MQTQRFKGLTSMEIIACNYSSCDDIPDAEGCYYAENYSAFHDGFNAANCEQYGGTACTAEVHGCTDDKATNYDASATVQAVDQYGNLLCVYTSCDDIPGGVGCMYAESYGAYHADFNGDNCTSYGGTACNGDSEEPADVVGCLDANADNYNADATVQGFDQWGNIACNYSSRDDIPDAEGCFYAENYSAFKADFSPENCVTYGGTACVEEVVEDSGLSFDVVNTGSNMTVFVTPGTEMTGDVSQVDQVGIFFTNDAGDLACAGVSSFDAAGNFQITLWASESGADNGMAAGEELTWKATSSAGALYDVVATYQDGSSSTFAADGITFVTGLDFTLQGGTAVEGCVDANADNYDAAATLQSLDQYGNSTCIYASCDVIPDAGGCVYADGYSAYHEHFTPENCTTYGGTACIEEVLGCTDANATNYDAAATAQAVDQYNNQLCTYASCDDVPGEGCKYADSFAGWNEYFGPADCSNYGGTPCESATSGCMDANATNYDAAATTQAEDQYGNKLCVYASCDDVPENGCRYPGSFGAYHDDFGVTACEGYGGIACGKMES